LGLDIAPVHVQALDEETRGSEQETIEQRLTLASSLGITIDGGPGSGFGMPRFGSAAKG
jgi:hypothetical protein